MEILMALKIVGGRVLTLAATGALAASLLVIGGASASAAGVSAASAPGTEVTACVNKKSRYARIVTPTTRCRVTEERITWGGETYNGTSSGDRRSEEHTSEL